MELGFIIYNSINAKIMQNKLKEIKDNNSTFALMIQQTENEDDYEESEDDIWPSTGYKYNKDKSYCIYVDSNVEDKVKDILDFKDGKATVKTTKTTYCYLYFDIQKGIDFTFYLGGETNPEYTKDQNIQLYINTDNEDVNEYCIAHSPDSSSCTWKSINNLSYTLDSTNGSQTRYVYLRTKNGEISENYQSDAIILDNVSPNCSLIASASGVTFNYSDNLKLANGQISGYEYKGSLSAKTYSGSISDAAGNSCSATKTITQASYSSGSSAIYEKTTNVCQQKQNCINPNISHGSSSCPAGYTTPLPNGMCGKYVGAPTCPPGQSPSDHYNGCRYYTEFSCPSGWSKSGNGCKKGNTTSYSNRICPSGYTITSDSGEYRCYKNGDQKSCQSNNYAYNGGCYQTASKTPGKDEYSCPSGYSKSGSGSSTTCCKYDYSFGSSSTSRTPNCTANNISCSQSTVNQSKVTCTKVQDASSGGYYCPYGYQIPNTTYCETY